MKAFFGRTQDAWNTPFDNTDPNAIASNIMSNSVQNAIIEVKQAAFQNDRYPIECFASGNNNAGTYLEFFAGLLSFPDAPFVFPENSAIKTATLGSSQNNTTTTIGFFRTTNLVTPVFSLSLTNQRSAVFVDLNYTFFALDALAIRVTAGSIQRPHLRLWVNTLT
jgi:hypothetical protein